MTYMLAPGAMGESRQVGKRQDCRGPGAESSRGGTRAPEQGHCRNVMLQP